MREEPIEFKTIREDFSEYEIENGQILKVKQVVTDIINKTEDDKKKSSLRFGIVSNTAATSPIDTTSLILEPDPNKITEADQVREVSFRPLKEIVNIYETKNSIILLIPHMAKIFITNKKDLKNMPHIRFTLATDVSVIEKTFRPAPAPNL